MGNTYALAGYLGTNSNWTITTQFAGCYQEYDSYDDLQSWIRVDLSVRNNGTTINKFQTSAKMLIPSGLVVDYSWGSSVNDIQLLPSTESVGSLLFETAECSAGEYALIITDYSGNIIVQEQIDIYPAALIQSAPTPTPTPTPTSTPTPGPTPLATPTISPTSTPQAITTPVSSEFGIDVQYDVNGVSGDTSSQSRLPTFNIKVAANLPLNQPPNVKLVVDVDESGSYSFQEQLLTASSGPVWEYSYTFQNLLPTSCNICILDDDVRWWVEVRAGNIGEVVVHNSEIFTLRIDQVIPQLVLASEGATALNSNGVIGTAIEVQWDGPLKMTSLSGSDFRLKTDTAIYVPFEIKSSDFGENWIRIVFDRIILDSGQWIMTIQGTVIDLAGNLTFGGESATVFR